MPEQLIAVEPHSEYIGKGCPTCHRGIEAGQTIAICPRCHTIHHDYCWFDKGGCGKVGCKGISSKRPLNNATSASGPAAAAADTAPAVTPVSDQANQLPMSVILGILGVLVVIVLYFVLR